MAEFFGHVDIISGGELIRGTAAIKLMADLSTGGQIYLKDKSEKDTVIIKGNGDLFLYDADGHRGFALLSKAPSLSGVKPTTGMWIGASSTEGPKAGYLEIRNDSGYPSMILNGTNNSMAVRNEAGENTITLDGGAGDIILSNADCAEDFDISGSEQVEAGSVMVIEGEGMLRKSTAEYDKRVVGVVSGAGDCKPGLILDKRKSKVNRKPLALMGKVFCKTEATRTRIEVGDLLTTSSIPGYAMKANDPVRAFGAVIGKALRPLERGKGLIPILVTLQ
jgi:hypothetical protein